jgi:GDP-4-dehydro-6-deoxy-D-mannose reductase
MAELALAKGAEVFGTYRWRSRMDNIQHLLSQIRLIECDLRDAISVRNALKEAKPDWIFHLAAQSYVPTSWSAPADTMHINIIGTVNLFEALRQLDLDCRVQVAGSSEEYGLQFEHELPIKETNPLRPLSPYAVSKVAQDLLGWQYHRSYGMFTSAPALSTTVALVEEKCSWILVLRGRLRA